MNLSVMTRMLLAVSAIAAFTAASPVALAQEDLPGRVGRVSNVAGELFIAPQDQPEAWAPAGLNYPVAGGDNLWVGNDGRAEVDVGGTQLRLAGDSNLHVSRLDDRQFALFVAQGRVSIRVRVLEGGEFARVDTPNAQLTITRPGLYRVDVSPDREHTHLVVREGEVNVQTASALQQVLPGQSADIDGPNPQYATVQNGIGVDGFDAWVADRDRYYRVSSSGNYVSPQMVGAADLAQYGSWTQNAEYGTVWYPNDVPSDWAPYRNGYWVEVGAWGPTWVDYAPWGYAPFHYGRWAYINGRWGWCPGRYVARPLWAPALVAWTGGAGWGLSVSTGGPVYGWVPLAWGEPYRPWWGRCSSGCWDRYNRPYAVNVNVWRPDSRPPTTYRNWNAPNAVTAVRGSTLYARQPVQQNLVRVSRDQVATAPVLSSAPPVRVERDSRSQMMRPAGAPPPASSFQQAYSRPSQPQGTGNMTRGSTQAMQPAQVPSSPTMRAPTQAMPSQPPMQRDESRRSPSYAQPVSPTPAQPSNYGQPSSRVATPQMQPATPPQGQMTRAPQPVPAQPQMQAPTQQSMRAPQPQPHAQPATPPSQPQGHMMRAPQPVPAQPQMQAPQQSMRVQPQVQPQPQPSQQRAAPPAPQAVPQPAQHSAPQPRSAPESASNRGQRDAPPSQDSSSSSGNMQRQGR